MLEKQRFNSLEEAVPVMIDGRSTLGKGSFGKVKLVKHKSNPDSLFAMKILLFRSKFDKKFALEEIRLHKVLNHPNIIRLHDSIIETSRAVLFLEYAEKGDLFRFVTRSLHTDQKRVLTIFLQCVRAVRYLHKKDIMHRDLKPENILLDSEFNAKLCDFGWSAEFRESIERHSMCGTAEYMAPEIFYKKPQSKKTDVWSLGILLYELFHRRAPFPGRSVNDVLAKIKKNQIKFKKNLDKRVKNLILFILRLDPAKRPNCDQILEHPLTFQLAKEFGIVSQMVDPTPKSNFTKTKNDSKIKEKNSKKQKTQTSKKEEQNKRTSDQNQKFLSVNKTKKPSKNNKPLQKIIRLSEFLQKQDANRKNSQKPTPNQKNLINPRNSKISPKIKPISKNNSSICKKLESKKNTFLRQANQPKKAVYNTNENNQVINFTNIPKTVSPKPNPKFKPQGKMDLKSLLAPSHKKPKQKLFYCKKKKTYKSQNENSKNESMTSVKNFLKNKSKFGYQAMKSELKKNNKSLCLNKQANFRHNLSMGSAKSGFLEKQNGWRFKQKKWNPKANEKKLNKQFETGNKQRNNRFGMSPFRKIDNTKFHSKNKTFKSQKENFLSKNIDSQIQNNKSPGIKEKIDIKTQKITTEVISPDRPKSDIGQNINFTPIKKKHNQISGQKTENKSANYWGKSFQKKYFNENQEKIINNGVYQISPISNKKMKILSSNNHGLNKHFISNQKNKSNAQTQLNEKKFILSSISNKVIDTSKLKKPPNRSEFSSPVQPKLQNNFFPDSQKRSSSILSSKNTDFPQQNNTNQSFAIDTLKTYNNSKKTIFLPHQNQNQEQSVKISRNILSSRNGFDSGRSIEAQGIIGYKTVDYGELKFQQNKIIDQRGLSKELWQSGNFGGKSKYVFVPSSCQNANQEVLNFDGKNNISNKKHIQDFKNKKQESSIFQKNNQANHQPINFTRIPKNLTSNAQISKPNTSRLNSFSEQLTLRSHQNSNNFSLINPEPKEINQDINSSRHILIYENPKNGINPPQNSFYLGKSFEKQKTHHAQNNFNKSKDSYLCHSNKNSFYSIHQKNQDSEKNLHYKNFLGHNTKYMEQRTSGLTDRSVSDRISASKSCNLGDDSSRFTEYSTSYQTTFNGPNSNSRSFEKGSWRINNAQHPKIYKTFQRAISQDHRFEKKSSELDLSHIVNNKHYQTDRIIETSSFANTHNSSKPTHQTPHQSFFIPTQNNDKFIHLEAKSQGTRDTSPNSFLQLKSDRSMMNYHVPFWQMTSNEANILQPEKMSCARSLNSSTRAITNPKSFNKGNMQPFHTMKSNTTNISQNLIRYKSTQFKDNSSRYKKQSLGVISNDTQIISEIEMRDSKETMRSESNLGVQKRIAHQSETRDCQHVFQTQNNMTWGQFYNPNTALSNQNIEDKENQYKDYQSKINYQSPHQIQRSRKENKYHTHNNTPATQKNQILNFFMVGERSINNNFTKNNQQNMIPQIKNQGLCLELENQKPVLQKNPETPCFIINPTPNFKNKAKPKPNFDSEKISQNWKKQQNRQNQMRFQTRQRRKYNSQDKNTSTSNSSRRKIKILKKKEETSYEIEDKLGFCEANLNPKSPRVNIYKEWTEKKIKNSQIDNSIPEKDSKQAKIISKRGQLTQKNQTNFINKKESLAKLLTQRNSKSKNLEFLKQKKFLGVKKREYKSFQQDNTKSNQKIAKKFLSKNFKQKLFNQNPLKVDFNRSYRKNKFSTDSKLRNKNKSKTTQKSDTNRNSGKFVSNSKSNFQSRRFISRNELFSKSESQNTENENYNKKFADKNFYSIQEKNIFMKPDLKKPFQNSFNQNKRKSGKKLKNKSEIVRSKEDYWIQGFKKKISREVFQSGNLQRENSKKFLNHKDNSQFKPKLSDTEKKKYGRSNSMQTYKNLKNTFNESSDAQTFCIFQNSKNKVNLKSKLKKSLMKSFNKKSDLRVQNYVRTHSKIISIPNGVFMSKPRQNNIRFYNRGEDVL